MNATTTEMQLTANPPLDIPMKANYTLSRQRETACTRKIVFHMMNVEFMLNNKIIGKNMIRSFLLALLYKDS